MGTYIGSPWGFILGKIGDTVGGKWKGINWARVRILPTQRGTLELYRKWKDDPGSQPAFSLPQMNIRRAVLQVLGYIARFGAALPDWIYPVWEALCTKRGWTMTGANAFVRRNAATLIASMDRTLEFDESTNAPDLTEMLVSDGDLEGVEGVAPAATAVYNNGTGEMVIIWDPRTFTNGDASDICNVIIAKKPILESAGRDGTWYPALYMYTLMVSPPPPAVAAVRSDGTVTVTIPNMLTATDLTAYLFFRDNANAIGYSPSLAITVTLAP